MVSKSIRSVSEYDLALAIILTLANHYERSFSMNGGYDSDIDFLCKLAERLQVISDHAFQNKIIRVIRKLVNYGALNAQMNKTHSQYYGQPKKVMEYSLPVGKRELLVRGETDHTFSPEGEAAFLLRRAFPDHTTYE